MRLIIATLYANTKVNYVKTFANLAMDPNTAQTTQTCLNRYINTRAARTAYSAPVLFISFQSQQWLGDEVCDAWWKTEEARVFRENFYGGKMNDFFVLQKFGSTF